MFRKLPLVMRLFCAAALLLLVLSILPTARVSADDEGPGFTPKQQALADRLKAQYHKLNKDLAELDRLFEKAAANRADYVRFMSSEAVNGRDTKVLEDHLKAADSFIKQGRMFQSRGIEALNYPNGLDRNGNVVDINKVSIEINAALPHYLTSRNYASRAIYYFHSALNLYHQQSTLRYKNPSDVPDVPKYRLPPYCLACDLAD